MNNIHLCIVSDQPLANLLPAMIAPIKASKVYLLCTPEQTNKGNDQAQTNVLKDNNINVETIELCAASDFVGLQDQLQKIQSQHMEDRVLMNVTGGTKPMSIAAHEWAYSSEKVEVIYLLNQEVIWLHPANKAAIPVDTKLTLKQFLDAHDMTVQSMARDAIMSDYSELATEWKNLAGGNDKWLISKLNFYASEAYNKNASPSCVALENKDQTGHFYDAVLERICKRYPLATITNGKLCFHNEEERFFCNGGWLENLVFSEIKQLQQRYPQITDVARSVEINLHQNRTKETINNELDVAVIVNQQLFVFECKTKRVGNRGNAIKEKENQVQHMIYKLAGIMKELGGIQTKGCVVSFDEARPVDKKRGPLFDIDVISGSTIKDLRSQLVQALKLNN